MTKIIDQAAADIMTRARTALLIDQPFFGTLAMRLKFVAEPKIKTLDVDGETMRYNPEFVKSLPTEIMRAAVAHEVMHCALNHCGAQGRGISLKPKKWNYAIDYITNDILVQSGFKLGDGWLHDVQYRGKTAEQIYSMIPDPPEDDKGNGGPQDEALPGNPDPTQAAAQAADWQIATTQAANAAKAVGKLPETLERFIEDSKKQKVDWQTELRRFITQAAKDDYSYARFNRKLQAAGFYLPGLYSENCGTILIGVDESGSVDEAITAAFASEIRAIKEDLRPEKTVLAHFDSRVGKVEEFAPDDEFKMIRYCNGGTDFRPVLAYGEQMAKPPICAVILTDLYGPFPKDPPGYPVLWVCINKQEAPFGATLPIEV